MYYIEKKNLLYLESDHDSFIFFNDLIYIS